nr:hypothetical protein CFP56_75910 [Quercus suber]
MFDLILPLIYLPLFLLSLWWRLASELLNVLLEFLNMEVISKCAHHDHFIRGGGAAAIIVQNREKKGLDIYSFQGSNSDPIPSL